MANRIASCSSSSPSSSTSAVRQAWSRAARCSVRSSPKPSVRAASASAVTWAANSSTVESSTGAHSNAANLVSRTRSPGPSAPVRVSRTRSGVASASVVSCAGAAARWATATATRCSLRSVRCTSSASAPSTRCSSAVSGSWISEAARGSSARSGTCSLASRSAQIRTSTGPSRGSTVQSTAATRRRANDTSRVLRTRTPSPPGETHSVSRSITPARRSSTCSWASTVPVRRSNGSSPTQRRTSVAFGGLITVSLSCGKA